jgi:hypothetical protein
MTKGESVPASVQAARYHYARSARGRFTRFIWTQAPNQRIDAETGEIVVKWPRRWRLLFILGAAGAFWAAVIAAVIRS